MGLGPRDEDGLTDVPQMRPWLIKREDTPNVQVPTLLFFPFGRASSLAILRKSSFSDCWRDGRMSTSKSTTWMRVDAKFNLCPLFSVVMRFRRFSELKLMGVCKTLN